MYILSYGCIFFADHRHHGIKRKQLLKTLREADAELWQQNGQVRKLL